MTGLVIVTVIALGLIVAFLIASRRADTRVRFDSSDRAVSVVADPQVRPLRSGSAASKTSRRATSPHT